MQWTARHYTGANVVVAAAGPIDPDAIVREVEAAFGGLARGQASRIEPPAYAGGMRTRRLEGSSQLHLVLGFPLPARSDDDPAADVAAAVFGDGMSSPLLSELRERRGLAYHAACGADRYDAFGQFAVEASFAPDKQDEVLRELMQLLARQAQSTGAVDLERARNQLAVRLLRDLDRPSRPHGAGGAGPVRARPRAARGRAAGAHRRRQRDGGQRGLRAHAGRRRGTGPHRPRRPRGQRARARESVVGGMRQPRRAMSRAPGIALTPSIPRVAFADPLPSSVRAAVSSHDSAS